MICFLVTQTRKHFVNWPHQQFMRSWPELWTNKIPVTPWKQISSTVRICLFTELPTAGQWPIESSPWQEQSAHHAAALSCVMAGGLRWAAAAAVPLVRLSVLAQSEPHDVYSDKTEVLFQITKDGTKYASLPPYLLHPEMLDSLPRIKKRRLLIGPFQCLQCGS